MTLEQALRIVKDAGYRVTKPKQRKVTRVGPTFVCKFSDGQITRMSTWAGEAEYDWERGERISRAAYEIRTGQSSPDIVSRHFEQDGQIIKPALEEVA